MNNTGNTKKSQDHLNKPKEKKLKTSIFVEFMKNKGVNMNRLSQCGNFLKFQANHDKTAFLLSGGNFCENRFCPVCSWLKAKRTAFELLELLKVVELQENKKFLFITLTAPNVRGEELPQEITNFNKSFKRLFQLSEFVKINKGFIRKLEVTYQSDQYVTKENKNKYKNLPIGTKLESYNTYHPHFHVIVAVNPSYFKSKDYLSKRRLLELWQKSARNSSITQVDIAPVRVNSIYEIMEMATYSAKQGDLLRSQETFDVFYKALKGRQLITYNGIFKEYRKKIKDDEINLDEILELKALQEKAITEIIYKWEHQEQEYKEAQERELQPDEQKSFYNLQIDVD